MVNIWIIVVVVICVALAYRLGRREIRSLSTKLEGAQASVISQEKDLKEQSSTIKALKLENDTLEESIAQEQEAYKKLLHQKKSSEVRTGMIAEQMAPFLKNFPYEPKKAIFMGTPIDFVVFDDTGVHFVEVKSGKSQLNAAQRRIREHIEKGAVDFQIYRIKGE